MCNFRFTIGSTLSETMLWIKELETVDSVDNFKSIQGHARCQKNEMLDVRIASALNKIIQNSCFKTKVILEEQAQKDDPLEKCKFIKTTFIKKKKSSKTTFIKNHFHQKTTFIKKKFHQNPHASKTTFIKNHFHQKTTFIKRSTTFIKDHFHQRPLSSKTTFIRKMKRKGGTINIVRVSVKASPKAGDALHKGLLKVERRGFRV